MLKNLFKRIWKGIKNMAEKVIETVKKLLILKLKKNQLKLHLKKKYMMIFVWIFIDSLNVPTVQNILERY